MDLNLFLLVNVAALSVIFFIKGAKAGRLWMCINGVIIVAAVISYLMAWNWAGFILAIIFLIVIIFPVILLMLSLRLGAANKTAASIKAAQWAAFLHPSKALQSHAGLTEALTKSSLEEQCSALEHLEEQWGPHWGYPARLYRLRLKGDWQDLLTLPKPQNPFQHRYDSLYALFQLQAFASLGRIEEMIACYFEGKNKLEAGQLADMALLWLMMFSGKYQTLENLLKMPEVFAAKALQPDDQQWMLAFAKLLAGHEEQRPLTVFCRQSFRRVLTLTLRLFWQ